VSGPKRRGLHQGHHGLGEAPLRLEDHRRVVARGPAVRARFSGLPVDGEGLLEAPPSLEEEAEVVEERRRGRVEGTGLGEEPLGLGVLAARRVRRGGGRERLDAARMPSDDPPERVESRRMIAPGAEHPCGEEKPFAAVGTQTPDRLELPERLVEPPLEAVRLTEA